MPIIIFEGPDTSGKTHIARALSDATSIPYYKYPKQIVPVREFDTKMITRYVDRWLTDFLAHVPLSIIFDRHYPTEWVYGQVFDREIDLDDLRYVDQGFAALDAVIVLCEKQSYAHFTDDVIAPSSVDSLREMYHRFMEWTSVHSILHLDTSSECLEHQLETILTFLQHRHFDVRPLQKVPEYECK